MRSGLDGTLPEAHVTSERQGVDLAASHAASPPRFAYRGCLGTDFGHAAVRPVRDGAIVVDVWPPESIGPRVSLAHFGRASHRRRPSLPAA